MSEEGQEARDKGKISITVQFPNADPLTFKIKHTTSFGKIYDTIAEKQGISAGSFTLAYDGERINRDQTPKMLELSDGDQIDVQIAQIGGRPLTR